MMPKFLSSKLSWGILALASVMLTILVFLPASWLAFALEKQSRGRLSLGDVQGSFWNGSAFVGVAADMNGPLTPLFAGRFSWKISPLLLLGQLDVKLDNPASLTPAVNITGNLSQWNVSPARLSLPPERLEGLGAPLNTIGPTGECRLSWNNLQMTREQSKVNVQGQVFFDLTEMASRLSPIKPLGSYQMIFHLHGSDADMQLNTLQGPMMLGGTGQIHQGRFQFSGTARAQQGQEDKLANLLNLLGQRRKESSKGGDKDVIALEFK
ncbi:type II secretion system protein N [Undibacterium sp. SXout7W]|uniref:type II secretion system protein N n=1 Tax=Undibacterium sp. SXout7W TaxID=3413049 RepID=UPI003BEF6BBC